ncbi:MAG: chromosome partitioning protein ParA [Muribaculaceae bacterium]|nr:chromosome partitioning protein ParA [Muribaculaceae bacterium]
MNELIIARINNVDIVSAVNNGETLVPIKPICTAIGIAFEPQYTKLKEDDTFNSVITLTVTTGADGKQYAMACLPPMYVYLWLGSINPKNVSDEARPLVSKYRIECAEALYSHFAGTSNREREQNQIEIRLLEEINGLTEDMQRAKNELRQKKECLAKLRTERLNPQPTLFL